MCTLLISGTGAVTIHGIAYSQQDQTFYSPIVELTEGVASEALEPEPIPMAKPEAKPITYTGYLVDNYCWDKPNHVGLDGKNLELSPEKHMLQCLLVPKCKSSGYVFLAKHGLPGAEKYTAKYKLDSNGNSLAGALFEKEWAKSHENDRAFSDQITAQGVVDNSNVLRVTSLEGATCSYLAFCRPSLISGNCATDLGRLNIKLFYYIHLENIFIF